MDAIPTEQSGEQSRLIPIPKDVVKAFGRGFRQSISLQLQEIDASLATLAGKLHHQTMENAFRRISSLLDNFEKAKEVKISILGAESLNDFVFSQETEELSPKPGELLMDTNITPKFTNALEHNFRNPLFVVSGSAEMSKSEEAKRIVNACSQIENVIKSLSDAQEIKIITDTEGNTILTPIRNVT